MTISNEVWANRIANATPLGLIIINYELVIYNIDLCLSDIDSKNNISFTKNIESAKNFLRELINSLNMSVKMSEDLLGLYLYVNKNLSISQVKQAKDTLIEARRILTILLSGFSQLKDLGTPVMANSQQIFSGLTYGRGHLNESVAAFNPVSRGFQA